ncbi:MAG: amidohydrolase family protein [Chloroflexota bacterium]
MVTALVGARLIDGSGALPRDAMTVVVDGGTIREVSQAREFGADVQVVDVSGLTIMPGLIDCHAHFAHWGMNLIAYQDKSLMLLAAETVAALRTTLEAGCTTARDLGGLDGGFRDAVAQGLIAGPRLQCSLTIVSPTNGIVDPTTAQGLPSPLVPGLPAPGCNGPYEARAKVREVLRAGADVIKIATTGGVSSPKVDPRRPLFTREEVEAIVDEAHMAGVSVTCHALGGPGLLSAVQAGVDCIEHGGWLDEASVAEMAKRGTWYVPTFAVYRWHGTIGPPFKLARAQGMRQDHLDSFARARAAGVRIAMGTDIGGYGYGDTAIELQLLVEAGMSPLEAIETSSRRSAECMGIGGEVGVLEAGKRADLLVIDGDPLADITMLRKRESLALVMQNGVAVSGRLKVAIA